MNTANPICVCFALPGLHRVSRGAEAAFEAVARELGKRPGFDVTLIGSGGPREGEPYRFFHAGVTPREAFEHWPRIPPMRNEYRWEELSFVRALRHIYRSQDFDVTVTCSYPFVNWLLRAGRKDKRPRHVFVTQNGDWPAQRRNAEYKFFSCDGLVCTNPDYFDRQKNSWRCALIPNGLDASQFTPGPANRNAFGIPADAKVILMVSAMIPSKRVLEGLRAIAAVPDIFFLAVGDGPLRHDFDCLAAQLMPGRHRRITAPMRQMPAIYRCADAFLHMSREEAFGNVYIEALASGLPVIAHDYATARWILQPPVPTTGKPPPENLQSLETSGWLVDTTNEPALSNAIRAALKSPRELAQARHEYAAARFAWPIVAEKYAEFLAEVARS